MAALPHHRPRVRRRPVRHGQPGEDCLETNVCFLRLNGDGPLLERPKVRGPQLRAQVEGQELPKKSMV